MTLGPVRRALLAMALGGFALGTGEFVMFGLLPQAATDLSVSISGAGELVSAYALGVVVGACTLTAALARMRRRRALLLLMTWVAVSNLLVSVAPGYRTELAARFLAGLPHGAFFGIGSVVAASLVPVYRRTTAMSVLFAGLTVANIVGVPATTLLGQAAGWRVVYALVGLVAAAAVVAMALALPRTEPAPVPGALRTEVRAFGNPLIWLVLAVATLGGGGLFATFSYITPMMTHVAGYRSSSMPWLLVLFGLGMTVGNLVGGRLVDRFPSRALLGGLAAEAAVAGAMVAAVHSRPTAAAAMFLFPAAAMGALPALQSRVVSLAGGAPNLAAASIHAAFNIANSLGAYLGGAVIAAGYGYAAPNAVAAVLTVVGLGMAAVLVAWQRRRPAGGSPSGAVPAPRSARPGPVSRSVAG